MRWLIILSFSIFISKITEQTSNYSCSTNDSNAEFSFSFLSHSAWEPTRSCALSQCSTISTINNGCPSSSAYCFDYRTINNISICAPAIQCSILESCNNITNQCTSNSSVCVINSCCSTHAVCLPLFTTNFCSLGQTALWTFDNTLNDISGEFIGTGLNSTTYTSGINGYGSALSLNGTIGQCAIISSYLNMNYQSFSWEFWVYPTVTTTGDSMFIGQCSQTGSVDQCLLFMIRNNTMWFGFGGDDIVGTKFIPVNSWSHMAFVYDLVENKKYIYLNGILEGTQNSTGPLQVSTTIMTFGCATINNSSSYISYFTGYLDQMLYTARIKTANEILDDATLVVYYRFLSSELLIDSGPNKINGTLGGGAVSVSSGIVNQAINFPVNGSYVLVSGLVLLGTSDWPFSLSLWFQISSSNNSGIIVHTSSIGTGSDWCPLYIGLDGNGAIYIFFRVRVTASYTINGPVMPIGVWNHVVCTFSTTNGVRFYINGALYSTTAVSTFYSTRVANRLIVGNTLLSPACGYSSNVQFYGSIDELRLYSREVTSTEVSQLYSNP